MRYDVLLTQLVKRFQKQTLCGEINSVSKTKLQFLRNLVKSAVFAWSMNRSSCWNRDHYDDDL